MNGRVEELVSLTGVSWILSLGASGGVEQGAFSECAFSEGAFWGGTSSGVACGGSMVALIERWLQPA